MSEKKTRTKLIAELRTPTYSEELNARTYADFKFLAAKLDLVAEAVAVILDEQRPTPEKG